MAKKPVGRHARLSLEQIYLRGQRVDNAIALMDELNATGGLGDNGRHALLTVAADVFNGPST